MKITFQTDESHTAYFSMIDSIKESSTGDGMNSDELEDLDSLKDAICRHDPGPTYPLTLGIQDHLYGPADLVFDYCQDNHQDGIAIDLGVGNIKAVDPVMLREAIIESRHMNHEGFTPNERAVIERFIKEITLYAAVAKYQ